MNRKLSIAVIGILCLLLSCLFYSYMRLRREYADALLIKELPDESRASDININSLNEVNESKDENVVFYICGEVNLPDIYELPKGSRIKDAIDKAGGQTEEAALNMMESIAGEIRDGQKIYVPNVTDDIDKINYMNNNISRQQSAAVKKDLDVVVNINTADKDELCQLPGIGEATAKLIIDYRQENGNFIVIEDIKNIQGIGDKTFENMKNNITVN